ncbi:MAG: hypothetical protein AAGA75_04285, partial [Cyanobacteria bacterium P01_E01_bin.6]
MNPSQPPPQKPTLEERITDAVFKLITGGGGVYALYNLYVEDIPKAAIAGFISLGSALITSFGQGFIDTLKDKMKQRGKASGEAIDTGIEWVTKQLIAKATGFENKYLLCQASACQRLRSEGVAQ